MLARFLHESSAVPQLTSTRRAAAARFALAALALGGAGCASAESPAGSPEDGPVGSASSALYGGERDDGAEANDAIVALRIGDKSPFELCTGTLVAPNVVLTARHCVSKDTASEIDCTESGESRNGAQVGADVQPRNIHVMLGTAPDFSAQPAAKGKVVFRPVGSVLCNTDIAIVVLDRAIPDVKPMAVRLKGLVSPGEEIRAVGYGENDHKVRIGTRFRKDDVVVLATGPKKRDDGSGRPAIADREFEVGKSICQGDSGGPAISKRTGAVIGVVSRGVGCSLDFGHIYTTTAGFGALFREAFAAADATPIAEPELTATQGFALPEGAPSEFLAPDPEVGANNRVTAAEGEAGCSVTPRSNAQGGAVALIIAGLTALLAGARRRAPRPVRVRRR